MEAPWARAFLPKAETGAHAGGLDVTDVLLESEIVGRPLAGQRLPKDAVLGLVTGGLGSQKRERPV